MLTNALEGVLGSTAKVKVLRALLPLTSPVSGREAKHLAGIRSQSGAQQALVALAQLGVLHEERIRGARLYRVNRAHHAASVLMSLFAVEAQRLSSLRDLVIGALSTKDLSGRVRGVILFGSSARGDARPGSDVDLLVVTDTADAGEAASEAMLDAAEQAERTLGVHLSPLVMPLARLRRRWSTGDPLLLNIHAEGRVLLGSGVRELGEVGDEPGEHQTGGSLAGGELPRDR